MIEPNAALYPLPVDEPARLRDLRALDLLDTPREPYYDGAVEIAAALMGAPMAALSLVDAERQWFKAAVGTDLCGSERGVSFCAHAILGTRAFVVEDALLDERFRESPLVTGSIGVRFYAGVPLTTYGGLCVGSLCVMDVRPRTAEPARLRLLERLAAMTVQTLEARRAESPLRPRF